MNDLEKRVESLTPQLIEIRRDFHRHPELSGQEYGTMERICGYLARWGIPFEKGIAGTGVTAVIRGGHPGKTVGLRADIDALPIQEADDARPCRSLTPGVMHACGHDCHTAVLLGTARALCGLKDRLHGSVKLFFQPAEEGDGGAERMIRAGCLENPRVDFILGLHVEPRYAVGQIGVKYDQMYAASDMIDVCIHGKAAHGAHPDEGVDAIAAAAAIVSAVQTVVSRSTRPTDAAVCSFGTIRGGTVRNQIADRVELQGILRTLTPESRLATRQRVERIVRGVAAALGASADFTVTESYSPLINTDCVVDAVRASGEALLGRENVIVEKTPDLSVDDFAFFAAARPACYFHLGCRNPAAAGSVDLHNPAFDPDERCLAVGTALQLENIFRLLG